MISSPGFKKRFYKNKDEENEPKKEEVGIR